MNGLNTKKGKKRAVYPGEGLKATLERKYIEEHLQSKGYRREDLIKLTKGEAKQLMIDASTYASLKLADIESRARFRRMIHWLLTATLGWFTSMLSLGPS